MSGKKKAAEKTEKGQKPKGVDALPEELKRKHTRVEVGSVAPTSARTHFPHLLPLSAAPILRELFFFHLNFLSFKLTYSLSLLLSLLRPPHPSFTGSTATSISITSLIWPAFTPIFALRYVTRLHSILISPPSPRCAAWARRTWSSI